MVIIKPSVQAMVDAGEPIRLDLGCGGSCRTGWVSLDRSEAVDPDILCDLEVDGIPLPDSSVDEVRAIAILEHMTRPLAITDEIWRVCKDKALVDIVVPHWSSDEAHLDPTHKSFFAEYSYQYFDRRMAGYQVNSYGVKGAYDIVAMTLEFKEPLVGDPLGDWKKPAEAERIRSHINMRNHIRWRLQVVKEQENEGSVDNKLG